MASILSRRTRPLHPLHAALLAGSVPLFLGALLSDIAYASSYQVQWTNFSSWLIVGGLTVSGFALLWALIDLLRADRRKGGGLVYFIVLAAAWLFGVFNALTHAKDAWAAMPAGLILSVIVLLLAAGATWIGFSAFRAGEPR